MLIERLFGVDGLGAAVTAALAGVSGLRYNGPALTRYRSRASRFGVGGVIRRMLLGRRGPLLPSLRGRAWRAGSRGHESGFIGDDDELGTVACRELGRDAADVRLCREGT